MPFTISHIAATVPFARRLTTARVLSAAIIGTMLPDADLLSPIQIDRAITHSVPALLSFVLPVGLLLWFFFQRLIKPALLEVLPDSWYSHVRSEADHPALEDSSQWITAAAALLAGAGSHLLWDAFTHEDGAAVRLLPILLRSSSVCGLEFHRFEWLQHLSSLLGLAVLASAVIGWIRTAKARHGGRPVRLLPARERALWAMLYLLGPTLCVLRETLSILIEPQARILSVDSLATIAIIGMTSSVGSLFVLSVLLRLRVTRFASASASV
jgi:membrane-bound metal-dependent hydrolase YbcI (DUF457 family)